MSSYEKKPEWMADHEQEDRRQFEKMASKELIVEQFKQVHEKLGSIEAQTKLTNGRVNKLEDMTNSLDGWRKYAGGALAVITTLLVPILIMLIQQYIKTK